MKRKRKCFRGLALLLAAVLFSSVLTVQPRAAETPDQENMVVPAEAAKPEEITETEDAADSEEITETEEAAKPEEITEAEEPAEPEADPVSEEKDENVIRTEAWSEGQDFDMSSLWFGAGGKIAYEDSTSGTYYLKIKPDSGNAVLTSEGADSDNYNVKYDLDMATATLTFRDLTFNCTEGSDGKDDSDIIECSALSWNEADTGKKLKLVLEGTNIIRAANGAAIDVSGSLEISGSGTLTAETSCTREYEDLEEPDKKIYKQAICVIPGESGSFSCKSSVTCIANNKGGIGLFVSAPYARVIVKGGSITGNVQLDDYKGSGLVSYDTGWSDRSGYTYVGRAYYYNLPENSLYPNQIIPDASLEETEWRIVGKYDADGNPIPSNMFYQEYYLTKNGDPITNDFHYPVTYLVYGDTAAVDAKMEPSNLVTVGDGKTHTFHTDLYSLSVQIGAVTVNGNIILDMSCFEQYGRDGEYEASDGNIYTIYERDENGNIVRHPHEGCSKGSSAVINGNVGCLSLHKSFKGNVFVNGDVNLIGYYDDVNAEDKKPMPETFYGAKVDAGSVIENGSFVASVLKLDGYLGHCVFDDTCYPMTVTERDGETVQGTSAPIAGDGLFINVGSSGIDETTFPCVRPSDTATTDAINDMLSDTDVKVSAMDIKLIQDNTNVVEPSQTVNLYIDHLSGYKKPALFHIKDDGTVEKLYAFSGSSFDGTIRCPTSSFSTYFITEDQELATLPEGPDTWKGKQGTEGFVLRLYNLALCRDAETNGYEYWAMNLQSKKISASEAAKGFFFSKEFTEKNYSDKQFVMLLYRTLLGRDADKDGMKHWLELLKNGVSREYVFRGFAQSAEFTGICKDYGLDRGNINVTQPRDQNPKLTGFVSRFYTKMLGRDYDVNGLNYWCKDYFANGSVEDIAARGFLQSKEFKNMNLTNEEFVTRMYETFLDRAPDPEGYQYWVGRLNSKDITRDELVYGFTRSKEFGKLKTQYGIE